MIAEYGVQEVDLGDGRVVILISTTAGGIVRRWLHKIQYGWHNHEMNDELMQVCVHVLSMCDQIGRLYKKGEGEQLFREDPNI